MEISSAGSREIGQKFFANEMNPEMKEFFKTAKMAIRDGSFNAEELAGQAPESVVSFAEEQGKDVESMLTDIFNKVNEMKNGYGSIMNYSLYNTYQNSGNNEKEFLGTLFGVSTSDE